MTLEYFAGIVDGEGTVCAKVSNYKYYYCHLQVVNTCKPLIDAIHKQFGGTVNDHCSKPPRKPCWTWRLTGKRAEELVKCLMPIFIVKTEDAIKALNDPRIKRQLSKKGQAHIGSALSHLRGSHDKLNGLRLN